MAAKVNLRTGKIIGAKRGSFAWWHEKGHIIFDDSDEGIKAGVAQNYAMYAALLFLALGQFWWAFTIPALASVLVIFAYFIKEEFWCNNYATEKMAEEAMKKVDIKKIMKEMKTKKMDLQSKKLRMVVKNQKV